MTTKKEAATVVGAAGVAQVGAHLALDSTLASVAAFGSVIGLGYLHLRSRHARKNTPALPDVIDMPAPAPLPSRHDETASKVDDLTARVAAMHTALHAEDPLVPRVEAIGESFANACRSIEGRLHSIERSHADGHERAADRSKEALGRLCRDLTTMRDDVRRALATMDELRAEQRTPVTLADDHTRALAQAADTGAQLSRRLIQLQERLDASLTRAAENGTAASARLDAALRATRERIEEIARGAASLEGASQALSTALAGTEERLARRFDRVDHAISALPASRDDEILARVGKIQDDIAALPQPTPPAKVSFEPILDAVRTVRHDIASLPRAEAAQKISLTPLLHGMKAIEDRIAALPAPERFPLDTLVEEIRAVRAGIAEMPRPEPAQKLSLAPILAGLQTLESRLAELPAPERFPLDVVLEEIRAVRAEVAGLPRPEPAQKLSLAPLMAGLKALEERFDTLPTPERFPLEAVLDEIRAVRTEVAELPRPEPAQKVSLAPLVAGLQAIEERIAEMPAPERFPLDALRDEIRSVRADIAALPRPEPAPRLSLAPVLEGIRALEARIAEIPTPEALAPVSFEPLRAELNASTDAAAHAIRDVEKRLRGAIDSIPRPEPVSFAPVLAAVQAVRNDISNLPTPAPAASFPTDTIIAEMRSVERKLRDRIAAIPAPETPAPVEISFEPVLAAVEAVRHEIANLPRPQAAPVFPLDEMVGEMRNVERKLRERIAAIPTPEIPAPVEISLAPVLAAVESVRKEIANLPRPQTAPAFPIDEMVGEMRNVERKIRERIAAIPTPEIPAPNEISLDPVLAAVEAVRHEIANMPRPQAAPAFPLDEIVGEMRSVERKLRERIAAIPVAEVPAPVEISLDPVLAGLDSLRTAVASLPRPEPLSFAPVLSAVDAVRADIASLPRPQPTPVFPLEEIRAEVQNAERKIRERIAAIPVPEIPPQIEISLEPVLSAIDRVRTEVANLPAPESISFAPVLSAVDAVRADIASLPRPGPAPVFPIEEMRAEIHNVERHLRERIAAIPQPEMPPAVSLAPVLDAVDRMRAQIAELPRPEPAPAFPLGEIREEFGALGRDLRERIAAIPMPEAPVPVRLEPVLDAIEGARAAASADAHSSRQEHARVYDAVERVRVAVAEIPVPERPEPVSLTPVLDAIRSTEAKLEDLVEWMDTPAAQRHEATMDALVHAAQRVDASESRVLAGLTPVAAIREDLVELRAAGLQIDAARHEEHRAILTHLQDLGAAPDAAAAQIDALHAAVAAQRHWLGEQIAQLGVDVERHVAAIPSPDLTAAMRPLGDALTATEERLRLVPFEATRPILEHLDRESSVQRAQLGAMHARVETLADHLRPLSGVVETGFATTVARVDGLATNLHQENEEVARKLEALVARGHEESLTLHDAVETARAAAAAAAVSASREFQGIHDAVEDLRVDLGGTQHAIEAIGAQLRRAGDDARADERARVDAYQARLDKLARDLETRIQGAQSGIENAAAQRETHAKVRLASISESLVSSQNAFQAAIAEALEATTHRVEERLATTEARLADAVRALESRETDMERRWEARIANMESRILSELGAVTGLFTRDEPATPAAMAASSVRHHARRHPRPSTE